MIDFRIATLSVLHDQSGESFDLHAHAHAPGFDLSIKDENFELEVNLTLALPRFLEIDSNSRIFSDTVGVKSRKK